MDSDFQCRMRLSHVTLKIMVRVNRPLKLHFKWLQKEGSSGIRLDCSPEILEAILDFLYGGEIHIQTARIPEVARLANQYSLTRLKAECAKMVTVFCDIAVMYFPPEPILRFSKIQGAPKKPRNFLDFF
jgi:hypothetical protein